MSEEKNKMDTLLNAFEEFKSTNDDRLKQLESKQSADVVTTEKVDRINEALTELQNEMKSVAKKAGRPGASEDQADTDYRAAFETFARTGRNEDELKSMTIAGDTGNDGGHTVPAIVDMAIRELLVDLSPLRSLANVITTTTGNHSVLLNEHGAGAGWVDEDDARTETASPKIKKIAVPHGELYANIGATQQLLDDSAIDVEAYLAREAALKFALSEGAAFLNGTGAKQPKGILATGHGIGTVKSGVADNVTADSVFDLVYGLGAGYRKNAKFLMNSATEAAYRKLKDDNGNYLWAPGLNGGAGQLVGYDVVNEENMADVAADATPVLFGDFKAGYTIADRKSITVLRDPFTNKPYVMFYFTARVGGVLVDAKAFRLLSIAA